MLWIECHDESLVNMDHVKRVSIKKDYMIGAGHETMRFWLILYVVGENEPIKVAHGTRENCKKMRYRIETYLGLDVKYNDRNVIRYKWLTHQLP